MIEIKKEIDGILVVQGDFDVANEHLDECIKTPLTDHVDDKKLDADQIARGIISKQAAEHLGWDKVQDLIAASLRSYGEAEYRRGIECAKEVLPRWSEGAALCEEKKHKAVCHYETAVYIVKKLEELQRGTGDVESNAQKQREGLKKPNMSGGQAGE